MLDFASYLGIISSVLKWIAWIPKKLFVNVRLLDSEISSREPVQQRVLWQIPVENQRRRPWPAFSVGKCTVDLEFFRERSSILKVEGRWASDDGPIEHRDLSPDGRIHFVPILIQDFEGVPFIPGTLRHTILPLEPGVVHVLGKDCIIGGDNSQRIDIGDYELEVSVKCDGKELACRKYTLVVPQTGHVVLKMASDTKCRAAR